MKNKDVFDLFRENEHKLAEQPGPAVWSRVAQRMQAVDTEQPRPSAHRLHVRQVGRVFALAAAIALVLGLAVSFLWVTDTSEDSLAALQGNVVELEELALLPTPAAEQVTAAAVVPAAQSQPARPIREGVAGQRLVVRTDATVPATVPPPTGDTARQERSQRVGR